MKNIHILPTDKPTWLHKSLLSGVLRKSSSCIDDMKQAQGMNIYITSEEDIKDGDWCMDIISKYIYKASLTPKTKWENQKKIILTTDTQLIKDGVQAIDDDFLEWLVKNPSCEFVEVKEKQHFEADKSKRINPLNGVYYSYKITIPQEEPKQECCQDVSGFYLGRTCPKCNTPFRSVIQEPKQEIIATEEDAKIFVDAIENPPAPNEKLKTAFGKQPKQETLEEAAENYCDIPKNQLGNKYKFSAHDRLLYNTFIEGAKSDAARDYWFKIFQQEQDKNKYSEEEVQLILSKLLTDIKKGNAGNSIKWFKQFKKK